MLRTLHSLPREPQRAFPPPAPPGATSLLACPAGRGYGRSMRDRNLRTRGAVPSGAGRAVRRSAGSNAGAGRRRAAPGRGGGRPARVAAPRRSAVSLRPVARRGEALRTRAAPEGRRAVRRRVRRSGARALRGQHRSVPRRRLGCAPDGIYVHRPRLSPRQRLRGARRLCLPDPRPAGPGRFRGRGRRGAGPRDRPHHRPARIQAAVQGHPRGPGARASRRGHRQPVPRRPRTSGGARGAERLFAQGGARGGRDRGEVPQPGRLRPRRNVELPRQAEAAERVRSVAPRPFPPPRPGLLRHPPPHPRACRTRRRGGTAHVGGGPHYGPQPLPLQDRRHALRRRPGAGLRPRAAVRAPGHPLRVRGPRPGSAC